MSSETRDSGTPPGAEADTETRIFEAALKVFARKGKDGARLQEIADEAGIHRPLLHYYFRTKQQLYEAVAERLFEQFLSGFDVPAGPDRFEETLRAFIDHYLSVLGLSEYAHADQGVQFEAKLFQEVCKILGIKKTRSSPYFAQLAGLVERLNSTVEAMLTKLVSEHQRDWDQYLQLAMWAYRSAPHASTGYSPSMMMYGREMTMPVDLVFGRPKPDVGGQRGNHLCFSAA